MGNDIMICGGRGGGGGRKDVNSMKTHVSFFFFGLYCSLLGVFCTET